ncbi:nuclear transcription factor y subunit gamma [Anaeramoeba flamelloides]|uniref:Nuclear transcription factor y subunit gamma n=1 Tax=Anaeramoeba flamelloides TaxID=1746091 RepID=A0AAV7YBZ1_9EUKA|nr:nuclear transcription factor y subunit gamma [Anaeramoeba flamelloides]KAJ6242816.1 nuclear transcription factor y subunit gamma [Anaeramoeba flamelloides]
MDKNEQLLLKTVKKFWAEQKKKYKDPEIIEQKKNSNGNYFKFNRIKNIVKLNDKIERVTVDGINLLIQAAELFILELTKRAQIEAKGYKRKIIKVEDLIRAASRAEHYDFLLDVFPEEVVEDNM